MITKSLPRVFQTIAVALPLVALGIQSALADARNFAISNRSSITILTLQVSSHDTEDWGPDILGSGVIPPGGSGSVTFSVPEDSCIYDIKATTDSGTTIDIRGLNLCSTSSINFNE